MIAAHEEELKPLRDAFNAAKERNTQAKDALKEARSTAKALSNALDKAKRSKGKADDDVASAQAKVEKLQQDVIDADDDSRAKIQEKLEKALAKVTECKDALPDLEKQMADAQTAVDAQQSQVEAAEKEADEADAAQRAAADPLQEKVNVFTGQENTCRSKVSELEKAIGKATGLIADAQRRHDDAQAYIDMITDVNDHPEVLDQLAKQIEEDGNLITQQVKSNASLEQERLAAVDDMRSARTKFVKLGIVVALIVVIIVLVVLLIGRG